MPMKNSGFPQATDRLLDLLGGLLCPSSWETAVTAAARSSVLRCPSCRRTGAWEDVPENISDHLRAIPEKVGREKAGTDTAAGQEVHAKPGQEWRCGSCGLLTRKPLQGRIRSTKDHAWRGHGRPPTLAGNATEDALVAFCDERQRWGWWEGAGDYRWSAPSVVRCVTVGNQWDDCEYSNYTRGPLTTLPGWQTEGNDRRRCIIATAEEGVQGSPTRAGKLAVARSIVDRVRRRSSGGDMFPDSLWLHLVGLVQRTEGT